MIPMLCMNVSLMEYMRTEYDNLHSLIEAGETRTSKGPRNKAEVIQPFSVDLYLLVTKSLSFSL
jgi:hypothetical protein